MASLLDKILRAKRREIAARRKDAPLRLVQEKAAGRHRRCRDFVGSLAAGRKPGIIGELKRASPVKGRLREDFDLRRSARLYEKNGVRALSVLTDPHFEGALGDIARVKAASKLPVLRKDFIIDEYQIYESYLAGADALLLIVGAVPPEMLEGWTRLARRLGMATLAEVRSAGQIERAHAAGVDLIGINNRDLRTFSVDIKRTARLLPHIPPRVKVVSESGISSARDIEFLRAHGVFAALVGESIVTAPDMAATVRQLTGGRR